MSDVNRFRPWELEWRAENIERFWNWLSSDPIRAQHYFARQFGDSILDTVVKHVKLRGMVVDLGCGPGYLVDKLLGRGINTLAIDSSTASIDRLAKRLEGKPHFLGAKVSSIDAVPLDDSTADIVMLIETIEHLDDEILQRILNGMYRITRPGGHVVVTTPNEEVLAEHQTMCPNCGCIFHTVQHMRSFSAASLSQLMTRHNFRQVACYPTLFSSRTRIVRPLQGLKYRVLGKKLPHLLYVGQKPREVTQD